MSSDSTEPQDEMVTYIEADAFKNIVKLDTRVTAFIMILAMFGSYVMGILTVAWRLHCQ